MILENQIIFMFSLMRFDGPFESTNYTLAKHLAKKNTVFYIDNPFTWKDIIKLKNTEQYKTRKPYFFSKKAEVIETDNEGLKIVITPPVVSINMLPEGKLYRIILKYNERLISKRIKQIITKYNIKDYIFINSYNFHYPDVADYLNPKLTAYHCVDPLIRPFDVKHGVISEKLLVKKSDVVICTSKQLYEEKKKLNSNTYFIPNAADVAHSQKALDENLPVHEKLRHIARPVIGYFGNIERRIDYELLKEVVYSNTDKNFVFAGPQETEFIPEWFFNTPNIHLTGRVPYEQMPSVIKGFDVALIPFKKDAVSRTIFPLKLFEYLGAGKPVVATDFNTDLNEFTHGLVPYCHTAQTFTDAINLALKVNKEEKGKYMAIAAGNTWDIRCKQISELLAGHISTN